MRFFFRILLNFYTIFLSPFLGGQCRFNPSCSQYARQSFETLPVGQAIKKVILRLLSCHPFHPGGTDPVKEVIQ